MPSRPPSPSRPDRVFRELARVHVRAQRDAVARAQGTFAQCNVLTELGRGSASLGALTARLRLDKGWVSRNIEQLVQDGLVSRQADARDRRAVRLALTARGRREAQALDQLLDRQIERVFARLSGSERAQVGRGLTLLMAAYIEELHGPNGEDTHE